MSRRARNVLRIQPVRQVRQGPASPPTQTTPKRSDKRAHQHRQQCVQLFCENCPARKLILLFAVCYEDHLVGTVCALCLVSLDFPVCPDLSGCFRWFCCSWWSSFSCLSGWSNWSWWSSLSLVCLVCLDFLVCLACPVSLACPVYPDSAVCPLSPLSGWSGFGVVQFVLRVRVVLCFGWICWSGWPGWCCCSCFCESDKFGKSGESSRSSRSGRSCNASQAGWAWSGWVWCQCLSSVVLVVLAVVLGLVLVVPGIV